MAEYDNLLARLDRAYDPESDSFVPGVGHLFGEAADLLRALQTENTELREKIAHVEKEAWDLGAVSRQCHCAAWNEDECACGNWPSETNPYLASVLSSYPLGEGQTPKGGNDAYVNPDSIFGGGYEA
jgi:hypothetical protein